MKIKYIRKDMRNRLLKSTILIKMVLFLFLGLLTNKSSAQNCQIIDSVIVKNIYCYGQNTGLIDLVLLDPLGSYSFAWNNLEITEDISNLTPATYSVQIIDLNNPTCFQDTSFTITQPQDPLSSTVNLYQDVSCFGDSTGIAYANAIGGTFPYTYLWSNGQATQVANGLWGNPSGQGVPFTHTVTITDDNGCILIDDIDIINLHPEIVDTINILQNVSCFGACDGIVRLSSSGGVLQYTYDWDIGQTYTGSGPDTAFNLCYGGHDVIIEDALGCRKTVSFTISQPDELLAQAIQVQPVQCYGFDDGISFASATGGTTPYYFVWDSIQGVSGNYNTGQNLDSLTPGIHTIFVTDANGCTAYDTVVIDEPTQLEVVIIPDSTIYSYCSNTNSGQLCALASGGTPGYNYLWNDALLQNTACATDIIGQYNDYTVIVMDARNCIATASFQLDSITNSMNPDSVLVTVEDVSCFGIYDGSIAVSNIVGAVPPFTYTWNGPGTYTGTGDYISSLYGGSYAVIIEDSNGCAITVNVEVDEPDQLTYTTYNVINQTCYGACDGQIWVYVEGGTGDYYYDISESNSFPISAINQGPIINDSIIFNLCEGLHTIYITDDNNCEGAVLWNGGTWEETVDIGIVVSTPLVSPIIDASCLTSNDGFAALDPGPDPLFSYTWETFPGAIQVDTGASTSILSPGDYIVVAHYADSASFGQVYQGCDVSSLVFTISSNSSTLITAGADSTDVLCYGDTDGIITLTPIGGASPYTFLWDTTTSIPIDSTTLQNQHELQPGTYTVTITDDNDCEITEDIIIGGPDAITDTITYTEPLCFGGADGTATITITTGGTPPFEYAIDGGAFSTNNTFTGLESDTFTINIIDGNDCTASDTIEITQPSEIIISSVEAIVTSQDIDGNPYHISCFGYSDGSAAVTMVGGTNPISYEWTITGGSAILSTDSVADNLAGDISYTVLITDDNGCTESDEITLLEPNLLVADFTVHWWTTSVNGVTNEISCFGLDDGCIQDSSYGGNYPYTYLWENDNTGLALVLGSNYLENEEDSVYSLQANTSYTLTVTDENECVAEATTSIFDEPALFEHDVTTTNYGGPTHVPFSVNFVDNTNNVDPHSIELFDSLLLCPYAHNADDINLSYYNYNCVFTDHIDSHENVDFNYEANPDFNPSLDYPFNTESLGVHTVWFFLTNDITGCQDSVSFLIEAQGVKEEIPNVFTPNGDDQNDLFVFGEYGMKNIEVQIFNRWGQLVASWVGPSEGTITEEQGWNGEGDNGNELPESVYFYVLKADGEDGHYYEEKGSITLLR